ncbi:MAG: hypothetical protein EYX74_05400 [Desulfobulbaceae bacterium]|nr:MAG: hypothetical protein EYX74_05400 [Desulfobulbaceae bacterium]
MLVASGYVETNEEAEVPAVMAAFKLDNIEVTDTQGEKILFLIERDTTKQLKTVLESLKDVNGVRTISLAYYSLECSDEEKNEPLTVS